MNDTPSLFGVPVIESKLLPMAPSFGETVRRRVRRGLVARSPEALRTLDPGPEPDAPTHAFLIGGTLHASAAMVGQMRTEARA